MLQTQVLRELLALGSEYDVIITPTLPILPLAHGDVAPASAPGCVIPPSGNDAWWNPYTYPFNCTNATAASVPVDYVIEDDYAIPVGLQVATMSGCAAEEERLNPGRSEGRTAFAAELALLFRAIGTVWSATNGERSNCETIIERQYYNDPDDEYDVVKGPCCSAAGAPLVRNLGPAY